MILLLPAFVSPLSSLVSLLSWSWFLRHPGIGICFYPYLHLFLQVSRGPYPFSNRSASIPSIILLFYHIHHIHQQASILSIVASSISILTPIPYHLLSPPRPTASTSAIGPHIPLSPSKFGSRLSVYLARSLALLAIVSAETEHPHLLLQHYHHQRQLYITYGTLLLYNKSFCFWP